ncbi:MAG TPA: HD domain-containing phosphohydrolase [Armatimonadota bacterium]|nr:HD domain-containing phosphohydrolase [Armatimonadota bacterium]
MKRFIRQNLPWAILALSLILITVLLQVSLKANQSDPALLASLHNLYYVPILLAAMFLGETGCVVVALCATIASCISIFGFHWPDNLADWWGVAIRGSFFLTLGYLAARIASRLHVENHNWQSLLDISRAINSSLELDETLQTITKKAVDLTSADACAIRLLSDDGDELVYANSWGLSEKYLMKGTLRPSSSAFVRRALSGGELVIHDVRKAKDLQYREETLAEGIVSILSAPFRVEDRVIGLLNLYLKRYVGFTKRDGRIAQTFAEQAAIAIQNARLYDSIRKNYLETVRALTRAIEAKDSLTLGHSERVMKISVGMAKKLGLAADQIQTIEFGALLHDLGKISLDDQTLAKRGNLSVDEQMMMEMHPMIGKSILESVEFLRPSIPIVLYHHERWDGLGYPGGMSGEDIPLLARVVAVADGLDHIMNQSMFPATADVALDDVRRDAGTKFDPALVEILAQVLEEQGDEVTSSEDDEASDREITQR